MRNSPKGGIEHVTTFPQLFSGTEKGANRRGKDNQKKKKKKKKKYDRGDPLRHYEEKHQKKKVKRPLMEKKGTGGKNKSGKN